MNFKLMLAGAGVVIAGVIAIMLAYRADSGASAPAIVDRSAETAEQALGTRVARPGPPVARPATARYEDVAAGSHDHQQFDARLKAKNEARWNSDGAAPVEAARMEQTLLAAMTTDGVVTAQFQPESFDVQCKSSMCRIESNFAPGADGNEWATRMLLAMGGEIASGDSVVERLPEGRQRLVLYGYRAGRVPPR